MNPSTSQSKSFPSNKNQLMAFKGSLIKKLIMVVIAMSGLPTVYSSEGVTAGTIAKEITLEGNGPGRVYEGVGGISASTSIMLVDYPEPQRNQILDMLFKPKFGASVQHLKVEMGCGENSGCGSEPSHAITRDELKSPKPRGLEFWLMREARKRNPAIMLDALPWGFPAYLKPSANDPKARLWSADMTSYFIAYLQAARQVGVEMNYLAAAQNECGTDYDWIVRSLRPALVTNGFGNVRLHAIEIAGHWEYVYNNFLKKPEMSEAIVAISAHYPNGGGHYKIDQSSICDGNNLMPTQDVKDSGKPLWASEEYSCSGKTWGGSGALYLGRLINKLYIRDRLTKFESWPLFDGIHDGLQWYVDCGVMRADTPWSGHYEVWPAVWAMAHTTQFVEPGWKYLDSCCGQLDAKTWKGTFVTLKDPQTQDWSMVVCTGDRADLSIKIGEGLKKGTLHLWRSTEQEQFVQLADPTPVGDAIALKMEGNAIYTLTTTTGQQKGHFDAIPEAAPFPFPWHSDYKSQAPGDRPRYFIDQCGTFEVVSSAGRGNCIQQMVPEQGMRWGGKGYGGIRKPYTVFGDPAWSSYAISADVKISGGDVEIGGRWDGKNGSDNHFHKLSYRWILGKQGDWRLCYGDTELLKGRAQEFDGEAWHRLKLVFDGHKLRGFLDGRKLADAEHAGPMKGMGVLASSYDLNCFDSLAVEGTAEVAPKN